MQFTALNWITETSVIVTMVAFNIKNYIVMVDDTKVIIEKQIQDGTCTVLEFQKWP